MDEQEEQGENFGEDSLQDKVSEQAGAFAEQIRRIGVGRILFAIVALLTVGYFASYFLSVSSLTVVVREKDSSRGINADRVEIAFPGLFGEEIKSDLGDGSGNFYFSGVPGGREVKVTVEQPGYEPFFEAAIPQGGTFSAHLYRSSFVMLESEAPLSSVSMGASCTRLFSVLARNTAAEADAEGVSLVSQDFPDDVSFSFVADPAEGESITIPANDSKTLQFALTTKNAEKGEKTGTVRLRGTNKELSVGLSVGENPRIDVSPTEIRQSAEQRESVLVIISNKGETDLSNIKISESGGKVTLRDVPAEAQAKLRVLKPGFDVSFWVDPVGSGQGFVIISADCVQPIQISVNLG